MICLIRVMSVRDCIKEAAKIFSRAGIGKPEREAEILLSHLKHCRRVDLYLDRSPVDGEIYTAFRELLKRRSRRVPLQYLLGESFFAGEKFRVRPGVFIPRPETEILLEVVREIIGRKAKETEGEIRIADICTGGGNVAVCLAKEIRHCTVHAVDISESALAAARENVVLHGQEDRICLYRGDLLSVLEGEFDVIAANPPYLTESELTAAEPEVRAEPEIALSGGANGLECLSRLIAMSPGYLKPGGGLAMEIGEKQSGELREIFASTGVFGEVCVRHDLNGKERVIYAKLRN